MSTLNRLGTHVTVEEIVGSKWNMIFACVRDREKGHCHQNVMKGGGEEGGAKGHQIMQVTQLGLDPMSF